MLDAVGDVLPLHSFSLYYIRILLIFLFPTVQDLCVLVQWLLSYPRECGLCVSSSPALYSSASSYSTESERLCNSQLLISDSRYVFLTLCCNSFSCSFQTPVLGLLSAPRSIYSLDLTGYGPRASLCFKFALKSLLWLHPTFWTSIHPLLLSTSPSYLSHLVPSALKPPLCQFLRPFIEFCTLYPQNHRIHPPSSPYLQHQAISPSVFVPLPSFYLHPVP